MGQYQTEGANPVACIVLLAMCLVTFFGSGRSAIKAILFTAAIIPAGQVFVIAGLHLIFFRLVIIVGIIRLFMKGENRNFQANNVDKLIILCGLTTVICGIIRGLKPATVGEVLFDWGGYFLVRCLCKGPEDFLQHIRFLALVMIVIALSMCVESVTKHNPFAIFGGVNVIPDIREGRVRCQGPFRIYLLAGCFAATLFPLMVGLWIQGREHRLRAMLGIVGSVLGTYLSNSSGPLICFMAALMGFALWRMRLRMQLLRRGFVVLFVVLALVMKAPVWYVIDRGPFAGASWHRSYLIDQFVQHFTQWAMVGTDYTANWAPAGQVLAVDHNNMDITNNFVVQGIHGGIWQFVLFLAIIISCFKIVGRLVRGSSDGVLKPKMIWAIGIALWGHCTAFIDISYFDQIAVIWYWLIAVIVCFSGYAVSEQIQAASDDREQPSSRLPVNLEVAA
jgi:hypothetical protein